MQSFEPRPLSDGRFVHFGFTSRSDGDFAPSNDPARLAQLRDQVSAGAWTSLNQVHGANVIWVETPGAGNGADADGAITATSDATLSIHTADCAPVIFVAEEGLIGLAHAGWRGMDAGVLEATVAAMRHRGAAQITAYVGPCIHQECYEFSVDELDRLSQKFGRTVVGKTAWGTPALDVPAALSVVLERLEVTSDFSQCVCTACDEGWYSHRARQDQGRQVAYARITTHP